MEKKFKIGAFCFRLSYEKELVIPENFRLFEIFDETEPAFSYHLHHSDHLPSTEYRILARRPDLLVFETPAGEGRMIASLGGTAFYARYEETSEKEADIFLSIQQTENLKFDTVFTSLFSLERRMIDHDSLILHCAYMVYQGKAVLFSAPSETGKSTQAGLWETYRGSHTINGDRALLRKIDRRWNACGWPVCGSSEICNLGDTPVHAIVMLKQGKTNHVERLSPFQAFTLLYAQITINQWNHDYVQKAMDLIEDIVREVPVWQLTCDISEDAVRCLEEVIF